MTLVEVAATLWKPWQRQVHCEWLHHRMPAEGLRNTEIIFYSAPYVEQLEPFTKHKRGNGTMKSTHLPCTVRVRMLYTAAVLIVTSGAPAYSQVSDGTGALGQQSTVQTAGSDIIVTAQRRSETAKEVPISLKAFSSDQIVAERIRDIRDYAILTPGFGFQSGGRSWAQSFAIRGVSNIGGFVSSTAVYLDEVQVNENTPLLDIEQIEVLRGPQGTLFGRNAIGGIVNITTAKPNVDRLEGNASVEYGNFNSILINGAINAPISDKLAIRTAAEYSSSDGYIENLGLPTNTNSYSYQSIRTSLRFEPSEATVVDLSAFYSLKNEGSRGHIPTGVVPVTLIGFFTLDLPIDDAVGFFPTNNRRRATDHPEFGRQEDTIIRGSIAQEFNGWSLIALAGYRENDSGEQVDEDGTLFAFNTSNLEFGTSSTSFEVRAQSSAGSTVEWLAGSNYAIDKFDSRRVYAISEWEIANDDYRDYIEFLLGDRAPFDPYFFTERGSTDVRSFGFFGSVGVQVVPDVLKLTFSGRYSIDRVKSVESPAGFLPTPEFEPLISGSSTFKDFSPKATLVYAISDETNFYASLSKGYKPGGFNFTSINIPNLPRSFKSETMWNYEMGAKGSLASGRVNFAATVFHMDWSNLQVFGFANTGTSVVQLTNNAATAKSTGVELELGIRPLPGLDIQLGVAYINARLGDYPNALTLQLGSFDASGFRMPRAPRLSASTSVSYTHALTDSLDLISQITYSHKGLQYQDISNLREFGSFVDAYDRIDARITFDSDTIAVDLFSKNILNSNYFVGSFYESFYSGTTVTVEPRTFGIRLRTRF